MPRERQGRVRRRLLICLFLALATIAVYGQVRRFEFVAYDDLAYVLESPQVRAGLTLDGISWAFSTAHLANWHPLTWISHMVDVQLFGIDPGPHHLTSLWVHIANALLLFLVLERMTGASGCSAFVAALFALHPLHVESVAWVAERKDVLSGFFWILTMGAYARYVERPAWSRYLTALALFGLGLMAKPMLVTLPFVLILLDFWPLRRNQGPLGSAGATAILDPRAWFLRGKVPFFMLSVVSSVVTFQVQQAAGAVTSADRFPLEARVGNALVAYVRYLGKMIWPVDLAVFYPRPAAWSAWIVGGSVILLLVVTLAAIRYAGRLPYLAVGWFWYVGTLVPVIGLVQVGMQSIADRYTYIPLVGIFIAIAWGVADIAGSWRKREAALSTLAGAVLAALMLCTWLQARAWKDSVSLFTHALAVTRDNAVAHNVLGTVLARRGRTAEAIAQYSEALRIEPHHTTHTNIGLALAVEGRFDEAIAHYEQALRGHPRSAKAHAYLGDALDHEGRTDEAMEHYEEALRIDPDQAEVRSNLGACLAAKGRMDEAIAQYSEALRLKPDYAAAMNNLAGALASQGRVREAMDRYRQALSVEPGLADAHLNLGNLLLGQGRTEEAVRHFQEVLRIRPGDPSARDALRKALAGSKSIPLPPS